MRSGWMEVDPREKLARDKRRPYVVLRPKEGKIYFSFRLEKEHFQGSERVIVRYNREMNVISFVVSENGRGYRLNSKRTIAARNLFNVLKKPLKRRRAYFARYNNEAKWLEIYLNKSDEGDMKWLKV